MEKTAMITSVQSSSISYILINDGKKEEKATFGDVVD
jgi:hypothetical protein